MTEPRDLIVHGLPVTVDDAQGHLIVTHPGSLSWDMLWAIKCAVWGEEARAIEIHPRRSELVNNAPCRHLWRLGDLDFAPDLLGRETRCAGGTDDDTLEARFAAAWKDA